MLYRCLLTFTLLSASLVLSHPQPDLSLEGADALEARDLVERGTGVTTNCKKSGTFAMTFDDGPYSYGSDIAKFFEEHGSLATFFVNGNNYGCIYDRADDLRRRYQAGHLIGSHTWGHDDITTLTDAQLHRQIDLVEGALKKILGIKPRIFRPPYGTYDARTVAILQSRGYKVVTWSQDSGDSDGKSTGSSINLYNKLAKQFPQPQIALNHETKSGTGKKVVPSAVPALLNAGYQLVTVAECLGVSPYQSVGKPGKRDASWTCAGTPGPGEA